jgi:hypothetical protein
VSLNVHVVRWWPGRQGFHPVTKDNIVGGVGDGGVRGRTMPWSSTSGRTGMSIGVQSEGMMSMLEGLVKIIVLVHIELRVVEVVESVYELRGRGLSR